MDLDADRFDELDSALTILAGSRTRPRAFASVRGRAGVEIERGAAVLLARIVELAPATPSGLAESVGIDASTASRHVSALVRQGFVARAPHPGDARAVAVSPTALGRRVLQRLRRARREMLADALSGWSTEDARQLTELMARFAQSYESAVAGQVEEQEIVE